MITLNYQHIAILVLLESEQQLNDFVRLSLNKSKCVCLAVNHKCPIQTVSLICFLLLRELNIKCIVKLLEMAVLSLFGSKLLIVNVVTNSFLRSVIVQNTKQKH